MTAGWADAYVAKLLAGETVTFRPRGHSMTGRINDGQLVTVTPIRQRELIADDAVLVKVRGRVVLHLVSTWRRERGGVRYQISNNHGHVDGWVDRDAIFGVVVSVDP